MIRIDQAFISSFINAGFGLPTAHENLPYDATGGAAYAELLVLQNDITALSMNDTDQTDGVFRIILRYPEGIGAVTAKQKADEIFAVFKIGKRLSYDGLKLTITNNKRAPGIAEDGWYKLILTIAYRAMTTRN